MGKRVWASVLAVALALVASPLSAAVIYVKGDAAGTNMGTSWTNACLLLQSALDAASSGDEIWVAAGTYKPTSDYGLVATGTLVQDRLKHFEMKNGVGIYGGFAGAETLRNERNWTTNITILSGDIGVASDASDNCYHVFFHPQGLGLDATAVLDGFTITSGNANDASDPYWHCYGGGMFNHYASPTLTNCAFSGNTAEIGGGMLNYYASPTLTDCMFNDNTAQYEGGGMCNWSGSSPTLTDCMFNDNTAQYEGGGMFNGGSSPTLTNCTFSGNSAVYDGGGMCNWESSPTLTNCTFSGNSAADNYGGGGGMYNFSSSPTLANCTFSSNSADGQYGGGGGMCNDTSFPTITNCTFSGNSADSGGGMENSSSSPTLTNCTFSNNAASWAGGMSNYFSSPTLTNCTFNENSTEYVGGGMENYSSSPTLANCTFSGNSAQYFGGGMSNVQSSPTLTDCTFSGNTTNGSYGGGGMFNAVSSPTLANCTFSNNAASGQGGGGMYNHDSSSPRVTNCTFSDNSATSYGGGMNNYASSPTLTNCTFSNNSAGNAGGGMENWGASSPTLMDCAFSGNSAEGGGGMINDSSSPNLTNCVFSANSAQDGGGVFSYDASPTLTNCSFSNNTASWGGGMGNSGSSSPILNNCAFSTNMASDFGGAIANAGSSRPNLRNCILWGDSAPVSPEVYNYSRGSATYFHYCDVQGSGGSAYWDDAFGTDKGGNIDADPLFFDSDSGDLHLLAGSPCIDAADGSVAPIADKDGKGRADDSPTPNTGTGRPNYAEIGAYEFEGGSVTVTVVYPSDADICLVRGTTRMIQWTSDGLPFGARLKIELRDSFGRAWLLTSAAPSAGAYKWTVGKGGSKTQPAYLDDDNYKIRVSTLDGTLWDESDGPFAIGSVTSVEVTGPATVTGGATAQYSCTAHYNFGADGDVTNEVKWSCTKVKGIKMGKTGLLTTAPGIGAPCTITATYGKGKPPMIGTLGITVTP